MPIISVNATAKFAVFDPPGFSQPDIVEDEEGVIANGGPHISRALEEIPLDSNRRPQRGLNR